MKNELKKRYINTFHKNNIKFLGAFCFSLDNSEFSFLLNKSGKSILLSSELVESIENQTIGEALALKLLAHGFIVVDGISHCNAQAYCSKTAKPSVFVIDITKSCNLNCLYCFRDLSDHRSIQKDILLDICMFIDRTANEMHLQAISIQLWGGEPLCNIKSIRVVSDFFINKTYSVQIDIETNATLITPEIAKELYQRKITVGVSIDGYPEIQNYQRPMVNNKASSKAVEQGIKNLQSVYGNRFGGICVITKNNYKYIERLLDYFIRELKITSIKFNLVRDNPNAEIKSLGLSANEVRWFAHRLVETLKAYAILGLRISEGNILTKFNNLNEGNHSNCCISCGCTGGTRIISFDMNGSIFPCEMTDYQEVRLGDIYSNIDLQNMISKARESNEYYSDRTNDKCKKCPWLYFCRGGCTSRVLYVNQNGSIDETECVLNQVLYEEIIKCILNQEIKRLVI